MLGMAGSVHQCRSVGLPVHDSRGSKDGIDYLTFISSAVAPLNQQTLFYSERVASWWHSLPRSRSDGSGMGLWRSATAGVLSVVVAEGREMPPTVLSGCVSPWPDALMT